MRLICVAALVMSEGNYPEVTNVIFSLQGLSLQDVMWKSRGGMVTTQDEYVTLREEALWE